jgi:hypothetical protein
MTIFAATRNWIRSQLVYDSQDPAEAPASFYGDLVPKGDGMPKPAVLQAIIVCLGNTVDSPI